MLIKAHSFRNLGATAAGLACGLLPLTATAIDAPPRDVTMAAPAVSCEAPGAGAMPFNIAVEPPADVVKGAPFSGVGTTEVVTTLADGNRITRTNTMRYFRDSLGRTRTEYSLGAIGPFVSDQAPTIVTVVDPVAGRRYVLHADERRADVFKLPVQGAAGTANTAIFVTGSFTSVPGSQAAGFSSPTQPQVQPRSGLRLSKPGTSPRAGTQMLGPGMNGNAAAPLAMAAESKHAAPTAPAGPEMGPGAVACRTPMKPGTAPVALGERRIEGLKVTGSRLELTIDAGAMGNEQPITVRTDQWFSPDLGVVVSSTHHDPTIGDTTYRLEQINRMEPDESLFVVPADYTKNPVGF